MDLISPSPKAQISELLCDTLMGLGLASFLPVVEQPIIVLAYCLSLKSVF